MTMFHNSAFSLECIFVEHLGRYYMCSKCNKPYFGGMRRCEQNMEEEREFNPADLVRVPYNRTCLLMQ
jgi:hypothetical protein